MKRQIDEETRRMQVAYKLKVEACKLRREELLQFVRWYDETFSMFHTMSEADVDDYIADTFYVSTHEMGV